MLRKITMALICACLPLPLTLPAADSSSATKPAVPMTETLYIRDALVQKGLAKGLDKSPELAKLVNEFRQAQLARLALEAASQEGMPDFSQRAEELYQVHLDKDYNLPIRLRVRVLEMDIQPGQEAVVRKTVEDLRAQIVAGKLDFKVALLQYSTDAEKRLTEGDTQWFHKGEKPDAFYEAAEKLDANHTLSDVFINHHTAYLLQFMGRKVAEVLPFAAVKADIVAGLEKDYREEKQKMLLEALKAAFKQQASQ
jgi:parvulin-like peptidyl-prolyl isomerase